MHKRLFLLFCLAIGSCPPTEPDAPQTSSSISYCSDGKLWLPGHSAPSGPCADPQVVHTPLGDMA